MLHTMVRQHISIQSLDSSHSSGWNRIGMLGEDGVPAYPFVHHSHAATVQIEPQGQPVRPTVVAVHCGAGAFSDRITKRDNGAARGGRQHLDRFHPEACGTCPGEWLRRLV